MKALSDQQLISQVRAGSPEACHELVRRFERPLLSLIRRMVKDPALAEDLAQEAFVKAFRHLDKYDSGRKLSSWLFKIAHNTTIDYLRKKRLKTVALEATSSDGEEVWEVLAAPAEQGPDRVAEQAEITAGLEVALGRMKPQYREVLLLRFQHGMAYHEIAEITGNKMGTVKIHLHRARKQLAKTLSLAGFAPPERFVEQSSETPGGKGP